MVDKGNFPEILTLKETAELLRLNRKKVYFLVEQGKLPGAKIGGRWRFVRKEILHWMRKGIIIPMKKRTKKFFSQELPVICMLFAALVTVFQSSELAPVKAEESCSLREIGEKEPLSAINRTATSEEEHPFKVNSQGEPWWQFPGWETVLAIIGCLYFILVKHFFHHFLTK